VLRSLLSETEVRATLTQHFVCSWVLKDDLARDLRVARARVERVADGSEARMPSLQAELAALLLQAAPELAQVVVLSPAAFEREQFSRRAGARGPVTAADLGGAGVGEGGESFLRRYTETGRDAAFDRTKHGFLSFLQGTLDEGFLHGGRSR